MNLAIYPDKGRKHYISLRIANEFFNPPPKSIMLFFKRYIPVALFFVCKKGLVGRVRYASGPGSYLLVVGMAGR